MPMLGGGGHLDTTFGLPGVRTRLLLTTLDVTQLRRAKGWKSGHEQLYLYLFIFQASGRLALGNYLVCRVQVFCPVRCCSPERNEKLKAVLAFTRLLTLQPSFADDEGNLLLPRLPTNTFD